MAYCSPILPKGWNAPVMPPPQYLKLSTDGELRITIAYEEWLTDLRGAHKDWQDNLRHLARGMYGDGMAEAIVKPSPALLAEVGPQPYPLEPVLACKQGNKWALGLSDDDTRGVGQYLAKFVPEPEPDFTDTDRWADLEEALDPEAVGGKKVAVSSTKTTKSAKAAKE